MHREHKDGGSRHDTLVPHFTFSGQMHAAMDPALLMEIFRLRYEVYCLECHFLNPHDYEHGFETDRFDTRAFHVASLTLEGLLVGSIRLVLAEKNEQFLFQKYCPTFNGFTFPPGDQCAEISRLIVHADYRRRARDSFQGVTKKFQERGYIHNPDRPAANTRHGEREERRSNNPQILLGMYREIYRFSRRNGIRYWFAAMERSLARILSSFGVNFTPIGPQADYYGEVMPYVANLDELESGLFKVNPFLAQWFIEASYLH